MSPQDFSAQLANRLRQKGIQAQPAEIQAFLVEARLDQSSAAEVEAAVERFISANQAHQRRVRMVMSAPQKFREGLSMAGWCSIGAVGAIAFTARIWNGAAFQAGWSTAWLQIVLAGLSAILAGMVIFGIVRAVRAAVIMVRSKGRPDVLPTAARGPGSGR
ncbi:MAG TPA: hypothetical protein VMS17_31830 [Gemmataceae bacterium]|nr:hypothetical protein [Gemmataceae bacterium]